MELAYRNAGINNLPRFMPGELAKSYDHRGQELAGVASWLEQFHFCSGEKATPGINAL
jgi:hypothetical protein